MMFKIFILQRLYIVLPLVEHQQVNTNRAFVIASARQTAGGKLPDEAIRKKEYLVWIASALRASQ
jgi:hypothetical protein